MKLAPIVFLATAFRFTESAVDFSRKDLPAIPKKAEQGTSFIFEGYNPFSGSGDWNEDSRKLGLLVAEIRFYVSCAWAEQNSLTPLLYGHIALYKEPELTGSLLKKCSPRRGQIYRIYHVSDTPIDIEKDSN